MISNSEGGRVCFEMGISSILPLASFSMQSKKRCDAERISEIKSMERRNQT
jgi:hypothetical protein